MTDMNETNLSHALPGQERYVAPLEETPLKDVDSVDESAPASSLWADAWRTLRKNPMFIISAVLIVFIIFVALFPGVMTKQNPNYCTLENSLEPASKGHPFGFDLQGCDVYSRVVHGTRTSLSVGVFATVLVVWVCRPLPSAGVATSPMRSPFCVPIRWCCSTRPRHLPSLCLPSS